MLPGFFVFSVLAVGLLAVSAFGAPESGILNFLGPPYSNEDFAEGAANDDVAGAESKAF